jgi:hypothetical protein
MSFRLFGRKDEKNGGDPEREEWLRQLGFEESYGDADADRKKLPPLNLNREEEQMLRQRFELKARQDMDERERVQVQAMDKGLPFVDIDRIKPEEAAIQSVSGELARRYQVLPVKREGMNLWLAMADPDNIAAIDAVKQAAQCRVYPVAAVRDTVRDAIEWYYEPEV